MILSLAAEPDAAFDAVAAALRRGSIVGIPTDTVYGIAALPAHDDALRRLFALKERSERKSVAVLVGSLEQAESLTTVSLARFASWWPGPLTVVVPRRAGVSWSLGGDDATVGLRCPDHGFVRRLADTLGPIATTSANRSGEPTLTSAADVALAFPELALVVDGGVLPGVASTVVDATTDLPRVLREGPITAAALGL